MTVPEVKLSLKKYKGDMSSKCDMKFMSKVVLDEL